jgi:hypothetical protein
MKYVRIGRFVLGLALMAATSQGAVAQRFAQSPNQPRVQSAAPGSAPARINGGAPARINGEELPARRPVPAPMRDQPYPDAFPGDGFAVDGYHPEGFCADGQCGTYGHHGGLVYPAGSGGIGCCEQSGQFFVTVDYLHVQAGFSDATAFIDRQLVNGTTSFDFNQLEFDYESSYRIGGGYRLCGCGEEIRFLHTRLKSEADDAFVSEAITGVGFRHIIPFKPPQFPGGRVEIDADVDVKSFDLEWAKTIPLGGRVCCDCDCAGPCMGDCGGCGDPCGASCPLWEITWSAGIRYAEADWRRRWTSFNDVGAEIGGVVSAMDFDGVGIKTGLEGRRYFFETGWLSVYGKGDISLLWGELDFDLQQRDELDLPTQVLVSNEVRQIIPVTELEAGLTAQVTCNSRISGGYLLSAWHDLGFRDDFVNDITFPIVYDDANILGFHGWFVRAEIAY